ncbi:MAG TPA: hypothetical protein VNM87_05095, partial [Candidatus Udaeobacter sp.]|nr:hypothetical protein [Candidatus Udaeobacter sp.]
MGKDRLTWDEIAARFEKLGPRLIGAFVYGHRNIEGATQWQVAGALDLSAVTEFRELVAHTGTRLGGRPMKQHVTEAVRAESDSEARWYRALETMVPATVRLGSDWETREHGQVFDRGHNFSIREPVQASADLCRRLHVVTA